MHNPTISEIESAYHGAYNSYNFFIVNIFHHTSRKTSRRDVEAPETFESLESFKVSARVLETATSRLGRTYRLRLFKALTGQISGPHRAGFLKRIYKPNADFGFVVVCLVSLVWYDHTVELKLNRIRSLFFSLCLPSSGCTAPRELVYRHEVEQIKANVFYSTFMNSLSVTF